MARVTESVWPMDPALCHNFINPACHAFCGVTPPNMEIELVGRMNSIFELNRLFLDSYIKKELLRP
jgi:hypothetical protein